MQITPWFGGDLIEVHSLRDTDKVAYSWSVPARLSEDEANAYTPTIGDLIVWHHCEHPLWRNDPSRDQTLLADQNGWGPTGVGKHTLLNPSPLHIEASVYWPDCCGLHGFIRDGAWITA